MEDIIKDISMDQIPENIFEVYNNAAIFISNLEFDNLQDIDLSKVIFYFSKSIKVSKTLFSINERIGNEENSINLIEKMIPYLENLVTNMYQLNTFDEDIRFELNVFSEVSTLTLIDYLENYINLKQEIIPEKVVLIGTLTASITSLWYNENVNFNSIQYNKMVESLNLIESYINDDVSEDVFNNLRITHAVLKGWVLGYSKEVDDNELLEISEEYLILINKFSYLNVYDLANITVNL